MPKSAVLEINVNGKWKRVSVPDAIAMNERYGRCIECKQPARGHRKGRNGAAAHVEHLDWNERCSLRQRRS
jgi:transposase